MKKVIVSTIGILGISLVFSGTVFAQGMMGFSNSSPDTAAIQSQQEEEQTGKTFLDSLNNKTVVCSQLQDADFEKIGEYFMGQTIGDTARHIAMNTMMQGMMGTQGEEQVHIAWGKRGSGCDPSATSPSQGVGFMSMMGGWSSPFTTNQSNNSMMNFGFMPFGWIFMILWWVLIIAGIVAIIKWFTGQSHGSNGHGKSALDVLKERYAKGEIDKKEFEEKKKDLI